MLCTKQKNLLSERGDAQGENKCKGKDIGIRHLGKLSGKSQEAIGIEFGCKCEAAREV